MEPLPIEASTLLEEVLRLFKEDYLAEAFSTLTKLGDSHLESSLESNVQGLAFLNSIPEVVILRADIALANKSLEWLADFTSWDLVREEGDIAIFTRGGSHEFYLRCEMLMHQPSFPLLAVFSEIDLLPSWYRTLRVKVMKSATKVSHPSTFRWVNWYHMDLPWPVSNRDILIACVGIPIPENRSILITMRDLEDTQTYMGTDLPPPQGSDVRIRMEFCCVNIMHKGANETQVSLILRSDPHIKLIPQGVMNYCTKQAMFMFMEQIRQKCTDFEGSEYETRVGLNAAYYQLIKDRATKYDYDLEA